MRALIYGFALAMLIVCAYMVGYRNAYATPSPAMLSIDAMDRAWILDLYREARANGECVRLERLPNRHGVAWYWLHSCKP